MGERAVDIVVSNASNKPIYQQIEDQIREQVLTGELVAGEPLPSIRNLASALRVSVITTKRAYADLEALGFIETVPGKGSFVAGVKVELLREREQQELEERLVALLADAKTLGLTPEDVKGLIDLLEGEIALEEADVEGSAR